MWLQPRSYSHWRLMMREKGLQILLEILKCARRPLLLRFKDGRVEIRKKKKNENGPSFIRPQIFCLDGSFRQNFSFPPSSPLSSCRYLIPLPSFLSAAVSSISWSSRIHLIMAAFPHLLPLNHSTVLYFSGYLIHLYMSHRLPRRLSLPHAPSFCLFIVSVSSLSGSQHPPCYFLASSQAAFASPHVSFPP